MSGRQPVERLEPGLLVRVTDWVLPVVIVGCLGKMIYDLSRADGVDPGIVAAFVLSSGRVVAKLFTRKGDDMLEDEEEIESRLENKWNFHSARRLRPDRTGER